MEQGTISTPPDSGAALDLKRTLQSGQTFCWRRELERGSLFDPHDTGIYVTVLPRSVTPTNRPEVIRVAQPSSNTLRWEARFDAEETVRSLFRLGDDLESIGETLPDDAVLEQAFAEERGLRIPNDPAFPTLIAFICSAQMSIPRIHRMQSAIAEQLGVPVQFDGETYHAFPAPDELATAPESTLRDLKLGYRAPYVKQTAERATETHPADLAALSYDAAHAELQEFMGVGDKVADCVQLYALGHLNAFPIDTWIETVLDEHFSHLVCETDAATARAAREYFGEYAGYAQSYLFAHARSAN